MSAARDRLAAQATAAGYASATLALIAETTLPAYRRGAQLDDAAIEQVRTAVEILAQAGHPAHALPAIVAHYRDRYGARCWREQFWQRQLRTADLRFNHPRLYGRSPCERHSARRAA
jgi:hypothetical protein